MATLQFKGKNIIWNHHMSVPYHTLDLDEKLSYKQDKADGNLIIEGDNLPALKSLLPQYTGKIDCIYIDPPYNTGNEGWIYNDNVNSPLIKDWIGNVVGKDDLTKHDKWLTMMTPRLKLLWELLDDYGFIAISIDDNEQSHLKLLCDEIFGPNNLLSIQHIQVRYSNKSLNEDNDWQPVMEYVFIYAKDATKFSANKISEDYNLDKFVWEITELTDGEVIEIGGKKVTVFKEGEWKIAKKKVGDIYGLKETWASGSLVRQGGTAAEFLDKFLIKRKDIDGLNVLYKIHNMGEDGLGYRYVSGPQKKDARRGKYYSGVPIERIDDISKGESFKYKPIPNYYDFSADFGNIWNEGYTPYNNGKKPVKMLKQIINYHKNKELLVLDSFAGSGSTAQAVLELNEEDEGNRKFILIQMPENSEKEPNKNICRDITRERVVKVIEKKLKNKEVGFEYRRVGQPIDAETILSGQLPTYKELAKYVFYLATGQSPKDKDIDEKKYLAGKVDHTEVYLLYTPDMEELKKMAITFEWAKEISKGNDNKKIVYAPACFMDDEYLEQFNIKFVSIPYNLFEREQ